MEESSSDLTWLWKCLLQKSAATNTENLPGYQHKDVCEGLLAAQHACPTCGFLLKNNKVYFKSIVSPWCKVKFCFVCLSLYRNCVKLTVPYRLCLEGADRLCICVEEEITWFYFHVNIWSQTYTHLIICNVFRVLQIFYAKHVKLKHFSIFFCISKKSLTPHLGYLKQWCVLYGDAVTRLN